MLDIVLLTNKFLISFKDNVQLLLQLIDLAYTNPDFSQVKLCSYVMIVLFSMNLIERQTILNVISFQTKCILLKIFHPHIVQVLRSCFNFILFSLQEHQEAHSALLSEIENPPQTTRKRRYEKEERHRDRDDLRRSRYSDGRDRRCGDTGVRHGMYGQQQSGYYMQGNGMLRKLAIKI
uniref:MIF4G domain-containing protein n=1 Tax=Heterorhabditis bacteriophora TaxID=37862 RepID=A0A1I7WEQ8_HETBA